MILPTCERGNNALRLADRWLGIPLTFPAAFFRRLTHPRFRRHPVKIGILCLGAVGDLLLVSALTAGIRRKCPESYLEIIGSSANSGALPLNPHADSHFSAPVSALTVLLGYIRRQKYDILIDTSQWARLGNLLCNFSGAGMTVGFKTPGQFRGAGYGKVCRHRNDCHEVDNFLNLGRALWPDLAGSPGLKLPADMSSERDNFVYCHIWPAPGPGRIYKQWPEQMWAELIGNLSGHGFAVALTGGADDAGRCDEFLRNWSLTGKAISIAGKVSWPELAIRFARSRAVIAVNTGAMHLAALAGAPTIALHGATNPRRWGPTGKNCASLLPASGECAYLNLGFEFDFSKKPSMSNLPVQAVMDALRGLKVIA